MRRVTVDKPELVELSALILGQGGSFQFEARGASMAPFILEGDLLTIEPCLAAGLRPGDVILYRLARDVLVAHRILRIGKHAGQAVYVTRGDAGSGPTEEVAADQVLGRVAALRRGSKSIPLDRAGRRVQGLAWAWSLPLRRIYWKMKAVLRA